MAREFQAGDDLLFQLESGFGLLRVLAVDDDPEGQPVWHLLAYSDLFPDVETAESALNQPEQLNVAVDHMALTNRAFERTPAAKLLSRAVTDSEKRSLEKWKADGDRKVFDRSALLMLGLR